MLKVIENFLSKEECSNIIDSNNLELKEASHNNIYIRKSLSKLINIPFIESKVTEEAIKLNSNIIFDNKFEFIKYGIDDHFTWHDDVIRGKATREVLTGVIFLNENFKGGELLVKERNNTKKIISKTGNLCLFSSKFLHKVTKVIEGERYSLCCWFYHKQSLLKKLI